MTNDSKPCPECGGELIMGYDSGDQNADLCSKCYKLIPCGREIPLCPECGGEKICDRCKHSINYLPDSMGFYVYCRLKKHDMQATVRPACFICKCGHEEKE